MYGLHGTGDLCSRPVQLLIELGGGLGEIMPVLVVHQGKDRVKEGLLLRFADKNRQRSNELLSQVFTESRALEEVL